MSNKIKDIDIKNHTYYFFNYITNINYLIQIILKLIKSHTEMFLLTISDM